EGAGHADRREGVGPPKLRGDGRPGAWRPSQRRAGSTRRQRGRAGEPERGQRLRVDLGGAAVGDPRVEERALEGAALAIEEAARFVHRPTSAVATRSNAATRSRKSALARRKRDATVPRGMPRTEAISAMLSSSNS